MTPQKRPQRNLPVTLFALGILLVSFWWHEPRTEAVFVYGTLKNPLVRSVVCWCYVPTETVSVPGFAYQGLNIVPVENSLVTGKVFLVSQRELERLDRYESVPTQYRREQILIRDTEYWVYRRNQ